MGDGVCSRSEMSVTRAAVLLGVISGVLGIAGTYLIVEFLPPPFGLLMPILTLAIPIAVFWPRWFDATAPTPGVLTRAGRRVMVVAAAAPAAALVSWLTLTAAPGFFDWTDAQHRQGAERRGLSPTEVDAFVAEHRSTREELALGTVFYTAAPGLVATLVTTGVSAIVLRRRPLRP